MRIATYNVNGIAARLPRLLEWLGETSPDIVCLQEIKCVDGGFPRDAVEAAGYHVLVRGQKGFHGVAILSRAPAEEVRRTLPGDEADEQARYLEADVEGLRVVSIYLPNGNPQPGPKFEYKLAWFARLRGHAAALLDRDRPTILAGDYNVCPTDQDVFSVRAMANDALMQPQSRREYRQLLMQGWTDALRARHPSGPVYTFWDYQAGAWDRDHGLSIDRLLLDPLAADRLRAAGVDKAYRGRERASDHAPTWIDLA